MATEGNWEEIIRTNYTSLLRFIDTDNGLQGELKKLRVFTPIALKSFWDHKDKTERIDKLLQSLQKKDFRTFQLFCSALTDSTQEHIVTKYLSQVNEIVRGSTVTDSPAEIDPLRNRGISSEMKKCLVDHWNNLIADISFDEELLGEIERRKICIGIQVNKLRDKKTEAERTESMLNCLEKGSQRQFLDFCESLRDCNQPFIVEQYLTPAMSTEQNGNTGGILTVTRPEESLGINSREQLRVATVGPLISPKPTEVKLIEVSSCSDEFIRSFEEKLRLMEVYNCSRRPRGRALIINNEYFTCNLPARTGAAVDAINLKSLFQRLHFEAVVYENHTAQQIRDILRKESADKYHQNVDMFVLFILSHGVRGEIYGLDGGLVKTREVIEQFGAKKCPNLANKPKLIFIQACRGETKTSGVFASDSGATVTDSVGEIKWKIEDDAVVEKLKQDEDFILSLPLKKLKMPDMVPSVYESDAAPDRTVHEMADMALIYATVEGHVAWRRIDSGSLFVQILVNVFRQKAHSKDVMSMITEVFNELHEKEIEENNQRYKQIGEKCDTLRRAVYLLP